MQKGTVQMKYKMIGLAISILVCLLAVNYININNHEDVHQKIFEYYGCTDTVIHHDLLKGETICLNTSNYDGEKAEISHDFNEIIGYNLDTLVITLFLCTFIICLVMISNEETR